LADRTKEHAYDPEAQKAAAKPYRELGMIENARKGFWESVA
jgi:hypothetical protein